jgi:hypothetical protein
MDPGALRGGRRDLGDVICPEVILKVADGDLLAKQDAMLTIGTVVYPTEIASERDVRRQLI